MRLQAVPWPPDVLRQALGPLLGSSAAVRQAASHAAGACALATLLGALAAAAGGGLPGGWQAALGLVDGAVVQLLAAPLQQVCNSLA